MDALTAGADIRGGLTGLSAAGAVAVRRIELVSPDGKPDPSMARNVRIVVGRDGMLSRPATVADLESLKYLRRYVGYGERNLLIR